MRMKVSNYIAKLLVQNGITDVFMITGGGAMLRGLEELIEEKTGINTMTAEDPMKVVAIGPGQFVEFMSGRRDY